jgi:2-methylcitrate dehydratase PrpD
MSTVAEALAARIAALSAADLPARVRAVASELVLDVAGLCVAARHADYVCATIDSLDSSGPCTAIGHTRTFDSAGAALINGVAAHGEDFDDTFEGGPVHAGAVIVPAVFAAAERFGRSGPDALLGITVGVETMCRLSVVAPMKVHKAGFHPTAVFGAMASAVAVGVTLGLTEDQLVSALGIAGSMASGIIEYLAEGTWTKRLHAGWAAQSGLRAALLARSGFVGPRTVFEGTHGLFFGFTHSIEANYAALTETFGSQWVAETLAFKPYACGTMIHPYIDCAIRLAKRGVDPDDIDTIVCEVAEGIVHRLWEPLADKQSPPNPYAAKFSSPFCIAAGFYLGDLGLAAFTEATIHDARIRALAAKISYTIDPANEYPHNFTGHIRATLKNGNVIEERQSHLRGGVHEPLSHEAIAAKFFANTAYGGWSDHDAQRAQTMLATLFTGAVELYAFAR